MSTDTPEYAPVRFSTEGLPERRRLALWRELFGREIVRVDMEPERDRPFWAEATLCQLSGLRTITCAMSGGRYQRTPEFLADGNDDVALIANLDGAVSAFQCGREVTLQKGEAVALSMTDPATTLHRDGRFLVVMVPRAALQPLLLDGAGTMIQPISGESEALQLIVGYVGALEAGRIRSSSLRDLAATHVRDLVAMALGASRDGKAIAENGGIRAARLCAIKADIDRHIEQPDLSVVTIAARHGISPRYVQALFEAEGSTFSSFVLTRRLARAHRLLASPRHSPRRIADIAFDVGFGDLSHFNRAFRRHYGVTPTDVRAYALTWPPPRYAGKTSR